MVQLHLKDVETIILNLPSSKISDFNISKEEIEHPKAKEIRINGVDPDGKIFSFSYILKENEDISVENIMSINKINVSFNAKKPCIWEKPENEKTHKEKVLEQYEKNHSSFDKNPIIPNILTAEELFPSLGFRKRTMSYNDYVFILTELGLKHSIDRDAIHMYLCYAQKDRDLSLVQLNKILSQDAKKYESYFIFEYKEHKLEVLKNGEVFVNQERFENLDLAIKMIEESENKEAN